MRKERWAFSKSELLNPDGLRSDDALHAMIGDEVDILVQRNGIGLNRWSDGTAGVPNKLILLAEKLETLHHDAVNETTLLWANALVNDDGTWAGWANAWGIRRRDNRCVPISYWYRDDGDVMRFDTYGQAAHYTDFLRSLPTLRGTRFEVAELDVT